MAFTLPRPAARISELAPGGCASGLCCACGDDDTIRCVSGSARRGGRRHSCRACAASRLDPPRRLCCAVRRSRRAGSPRAGRAAARRAGGEHTPFEALSTVRSTRQTSSSRRKHEPPKPSLWLHPLRSRYRFFRQLTRPRSQAPTCAALPLRMSARASRVMRHRARQLHMRPHLDVQRSAIVHHSNRMTSPLASGAPAAP